MEEHIKEIIALTGVLQEFRTIYIAGTFAILGFVIQKNGYRNQAERFIISFAFLFFGLGNLFQIRQTSENIESLVGESGGFRYVTPIQAILAHIPFDIAIFCILMFVFKVVGESSEPNTQANKDASR